jgi:hypothetical protein
VTDKPLSPSTQLADLVVNRLIEAGLMRPDQKQKMIQSIGSAEIKGSDWRLEIELSEAKEASA